MEDCIFCKIINGDIPSNKIYEDDQILAFYDIDKKAPVHFLVIPKKHVKSILELQESDSELLGHIFCTIGKLAKELGIADGGFRTVINTGDDAGQSVHHLHFHVLGGRYLEWPPG